MKQLLTNSRQQSFKTCRKAHYFGYELGLRKIDDARALRMGSAGHAGVESLGNGGTIADACAAVESHYTNCPQQFDLYQWQIEYETMRRLVCAYQWRWANDGIKNVRTEFAFQHPLVNPSTGAATPIFDLAGKIDGIIELEDGRLAVKETKFLGEDLGADGSLWRRLRRDSQISIYMIAARKSGFDVSTVLYDCIRKPSISAVPIPLTDENGIKIVLDSSGERIRNASGKKKWRQTGDTERGWIIQTRPMTIREWGDRLTKDIVERPDFYFVRKEIPRLDGDLAETESELWEVQLAIREAERSGHWFRTVNRNTCPFCAFDSVCDNPVNPKSPPIGFEILSNVHPELGDSLPLTELERQHAISAASSSARETAAPTVEATAAS